MITIVKSNFFIFSHNFSLKTKETIIIHVHPSGKSILCLTTLRFTDRNSYLLSNVDNFLQKEVNYPCWLWRTNYNHNNPLQENDDIDTKMDARHTDPGNSSLYCTQIQVTHTYTVHRSR